MAEEDGTDYLEYVITLGAACLFCYQKYHREITRVIWEMKEDRILWLNDE